jgi:hypothetical protein
MDPERRAAVIAVGVLAAVLLAPALGRAEPYLAVRAGAKCVACHVNPTGGGKRTEFGAIYGQRELPAQSAPAPWRGTLNEHVALGGDYRASLDSRSIPNTRDTLEFNTRGQLYVEVKAILERLTLYLDERVAPGAASSREAFAMLWFGERAAYVKAGRLFIPFGLRIEDDGAFIRQVSGTTFSSSDDGVEGGVEIGPWSAAVAATNGAGGAAETNRSKQLAGLASYVRPAWRAGWSFATNSGDAAKRRMQSIFGGLRTGDVSWIASALHLADESSAGEAKQWAALAEANVAVVKGHNVKLTYEYHDPDRNVRENHRARYSAVWEYVPFQFTQLRAGVRKNDGIPQNDLQNATDFFLQWHAFF